MTTNIQRDGGKVYIAIASHFSSNDVLFVQSLSQLIVSPPCRIQIGWNCDPSVERARNGLAATFLASDCTHILFVDSDIGFTPADVGRVMQHSEPVVGGMYPLKRDGRKIEWCGNGLIDREAPVRPDGLQQVRYIGTGFLRIARSVFETLLDHDRAEIEYQSDAAPHRTEWAFFRQQVRKTDDARRRFLTEDWLFCQRWNELGGSVYADTRVILRHAGRAVWPLPLQEDNPFEPAKPAAAAAT